MRPSILSGLPEKTDLKVPRGKHGLLFDCHNLWHSARRYGNFNYKAAYDLFGKEKVKEAILFLASDDVNIDHRLRRMFGDHFQVEARPLSMSENGRIKANCDVDIAIKAFDLVTRQRVRKLYLFSGDGDFAPLITYLDDRFDVEVHVLAFPGSVSELVKMIAPSVTLIGSDLITSGGERDGSQML